MMRWPKVAALLMLPAVAACTWRKTPVTLIPETGSVALLVGVWSGEYSSPQTGRSGSITFDLASEKDTAFCDIVMVPKIQQNPAEAVDRAVVRPLPSNQPLKVRFIRLGDRRISGTLEPYVDPDCGCRVSTTFEGIITSANTIEGTYSSVSSALDYSRTGGRWKVTRQKVTAMTQ